MWTETDFLILFNDSKYLQDAFEDYESNEISYMDVFQEIEQTNKVSFHLLYKFYIKKHKQYSDSDLFMLFNSMHYLNCKRITELYSRIYKSENYDTLSEDIKKEMKIYLNKIKQVACNDYKHYVLLNDGTIISHVNSNDVDPDMEQYYHCLNSPSEKFTQIACSNGEHSVGIKEDGTLITWGHELKEHNHSPEGKFTQIACGTTHSVGIREDRTVVTWGSNSAGQHDNSPSGKFVQIACGSTHSVGIREDRSVVTWGRNLEKQYDNSPEGKFIQIACGLYHSVGIREDGTVVTWGCNFEKQYNNSPSGKFIQIACGDYHSVGIREDGTVVTWGDNSWNQYKNSPSGKFIQVDCASLYSIGIRENGQIIAWGNEDYQYINKKYNLLKHKFVQITCSPWCTIGTTEDDNVVIIHGEMPY